MRRRASAWNRRWTPGRSRPGVGTCSTTAWSRTRISPGSSRFRRKTPPADVWRASSRPFTRTTDSGAIADIAKAIESGAYFESDYRIVAADGSIRWVVARGTVDRDVAGESTNLTGAVFDITERKRIEEALRESEETLRQGDQRKDEFLAMLAHELRNPLAAINGAFVVATRSDLRREHVEWSMEVIERQIKHLGRLIDDLLDVSRITRGKIQLRKNIIDAYPALKGAVEAVQPLIEERKHELTVSFQPGLWLDADPTRLEQIILNLLANAAKYTESGGRLWLSAYREGRDVVISVRDNGIGIAPEKLPEMFELFAQGDRSIARSEGGLGIGLTLVKRLTEMHGGRVTATSDGPGLGSEFIVRLPAADAPLEESRTPPPNLSQAPPRFGASSSSMTTWTRRAERRSSSSSSVTLWRSSTTAPRPSKPPKRSAPISCSWTSACRAWTAIRSPRC